MKTIRNAALSALCLMLATAAAPTAQAQDGPHGFHGSHGHGSSYQYGQHFHHFTKIPAGSMITIPGYFGEHPGHAFLFAAGAKHHLKVVAFTPKCIKLLMPFMKLAEAAPGRLLVFGLHGQVYGSFPVLMLPPVIKKTVAPPIKAGPATIKVVPPIAKAGPPPVKVVPPIVNAVPAVNPPIVNAVPPPVNAVPPIVKVEVPPKKAGGLSDKAEVPPKKEPGAAGVNGKLQPQIIVEPAPAKLQGQTGEAKPAAPPVEGAKQP